MKFLVVIAFILLLCATLPPEDVIWDLKAGAILGTVWFLFDVVTGRVG